MYLYIEGPLTIWYQRGTPLICYDTSIKLGDLQETVLKKENGRNQYTICPIMQLFPAW